MSALSVTKIGFGGIAAARAVTTTLTTVGWRQVRLAVGDNYLWQPGTKAQVKQGRW
jgi:hypothetical protein